MFRLTVFILLLSSLAGCISAPPTTADWPSNLPPRELYETAWAQDTANQEVQSLNAYLRWVLRFYQGWPVYDYGWLDITRDVLASIQEPAEKESVAEQLIEMVVTKKNLDVQWNLQSVLKFWLFIHVPLSFGLLALAAAHIALVWQFL